jgi:hypothetical protein
MARQTIRECQAARLSANQQCQTFEYSRHAHACLDGTVFAIPVDKNAPSSRTYLAHPARDAVVGQAKNRARSRTDPFERASLKCSG